jgi:hypothetical protein
VLGHACHVLFEIAAIVPMTVTFGLPFQLNGASATGMRERRAIYRPQFCRFTPEDPAGPPARDIQGFSVLR